MEKANVHILKFKSFANASRSALREFIESEFDIERVNAFFAGFKDKRPFYYKPGIYRFHSFSDARKDDMQRMLEKACRRKN